MIIWKVSLKSFELFRFPNVDVSFICHLVCPVPPVKPAYFNLLSPFQTATWIRKYGYRQCLIRQSCTYYQAL